MTTGVSEADNLTEEKKNSGPVSGRLLVAESNATRSLDNHEEMRGSVPFKMVVLQVLFCILPKGASQARLSSSAGLGKATTTRSWLSEVRVSTWGPRNPC
jgi:hypothetical protein